MPVAGKFIGASAALFVGSAVFFAPAVLIGSGDSGHMLPVDTVHAEPDDGEMQAREKLDAAGRAAFAQIDDMVTGSLPPDAAAAAAANPMTARLPAIGENSGFPAIVGARPARPRGAATPLDVKTVGSIPPREVNDEAADDVTASVGKPAAAMPAPQRTKGAEAAKAPAPAARKSVRTERPRRTQAAPPRFRDRGPLAKVFRVFVMGVGFLPSRF